MDFQLNPDAAEFIPVSPIIPSRLMDQPIAGSPLKQMTIMDDIRLPSPKEFTEEANHRPHEVDGKEDMINSSNGDFSTNNDGIELIDKPKLQFNLDESEISSTRAEFGDESTASFLTTADYPKNDINDGMDGSFTDSCLGTCDNECMMMSFGPGAFNPLSNPVDLNAVHDLSDTDLCDQDDQLSLKASQLQGDEKGIGEYIENEKREVYSPDVHPELAHLISPESDQPPHSVAFPNHEDKDLLGTSSPVPESNSYAEEFQEKVENIMSEVAAMNLKNEQLSEVHDEKELDTAESANVTAADIESTSSIQQLTHLDDISPAPQASPSLMNIDDYSSSGLQFTSSMENFSEETAEISSPKPDKTQEQYETSDLLSNDNVELSAMPDLIQSNKEDIPQVERSSSPRLEVFENPLDNDFVLNSKADNTSYVPQDDVEDEVKMFNDDDGPINPQFDIPTGDPCSRSLSITPEPQEIHEKIVEDQLAAQPQISNMNTPPKLSESDEKLTDLESEPTLANGIVTKTEIQVPEVAIPVLISEEKCEKMSEDDTSSVPVIEETEKSSITPEGIEINPSIATVTTAAVISAATAATAPVKSKTTAKSPLKTATKIVASKATNKLSPTSPTKALSALSRPSSSPTAKKPATTPTTARLKPTDTMPKTSATTNKSPIAKSAAKPPRMTTAPKPKTTSVKSSTAIIERKPNGVVATNGEVKSVTAKSTPKSKTTVANNVATKPLVKSTMTSTRSTTTLTTKSKPATIGSTTSKVTTKPTATVTSTTANAARPKTAPATLGVTKSRTPNTKKSPVLDKQIKETANKQISSSRTSTTTTASRTSRTSNSLTTATVTSSATSAKRITATAPTKKPLTATRMSAKSATAVSKTTTKTNSVKTKMQNGVCEMKETKTNTVEAATTMTTTNEPDIPQKDGSPIVPTTDNHLLITTD